MTGSLFCTGNQTYRKEVVLVVVALAVLSMTGACARKSDDRPKDLIDIADRAYEMGNYEQVIAISNQLIAASPKDPDAYYYRGHGYLLQGALSSAMEDFDVTLRLDPGYAPAALGRANVYRHRGDSEMAMAEINRAKSLGLSESKYQYSLGVICEDAREYDSALDHFKKALKIDPGYASARNDVGAVYWWKGDYENAVQWCTSALVVDPSMKEAYYDRGLAYYYLGNYQQAISDFSASIALGFRIEKPFAHRGEAYMAIGNLNRAIADFKEALSIQPDLEYAREDLAKAEAISRRRGIS
jgi:tetratricopeptide (TPR) repeat protein